MKRLHSSGQRIGQDQLARVQAWVGCIIEIPTGAISVSCRVTDAKIAWGRLRLEVEPLAGGGRAWVDARGRGLEGGGAGGDAAEQ